MRDSGQSTIEYCVLVLVAVAVLGAGAVGLHESGIAEAFIAQIERAICRVGGGECREPPEPCVTSSTATSDDTNVRLGILRLRGGRTLLRERRSDGSERVTLMKRSGAGGGLALGGDVGVGTWVLGGRLDGMIEIRGGRGQVWTLRSAREADTLVRALVARPEARTHNPRLRVRRRKQLPAPDVVFSDHGLGTTISGGLERIGLSLDAEDLSTTRTDRRSGERTLFIRRRNEVLASVGVVGPLGAEGGARSDERAALVIDARGRPLRLSVTGVRRVQAGVQLPGPLRTLAAGRLPLRQGRVVETERRLDLSDPANLAAAGAFMRALRDPRLLLGPAFAVSDALRRRLDAAGETRMRVYALDVRHTGAHAGLDLGLGLGGGYEHAVETARLIGATEREAGGVWRQRDDCLLAA